MGFLGHLRCFAVLASFSVASAAPVSAQTGGGGSPRPPIRLVNDPAEFGPEGRPGREQHRGEVLDMRAHPELAGMAGRTRELLDRLLIPEDRYREIELVFLDDMRPNATFQKFKSGKARVTVNLGLFDVVDSDDEFAGILGHELEHGHSDLHDRAAEAEVDVRSVVRRVLPNGFNPHALARFFVKMRRKYGDHGGPTHVSSASRWDALALANEKLMADGMKFPADDPKLFRRSVVGPFRELYLLNGTWRDAARARWRADAEKIVGQGRTLLARLDELPVREGVELPEGIERAWGMLKGALEQRAQVLLGDALEDPKLAAEIRRETRAGVWGLYAERVRTLDHARAMSTTQGLEVVAAVLARPGVWQEYSLPVIARGLLAREALAAGGEHSRYDEAELKEQAAQVAEAERWFQPWSEVEAAAREYSATARRDPEGEGRRARLEEAHWGRAKSPLREAVGAETEVGARLKASVREMIEARVDDVARWGELDPLWSLVLKLDARYPEYAPILTQMFEAAQRSVGSVEGPARAQRLAEVLDQKQFQLVLGWMKQSDESSPAALALLDQFTEIQLRRPGVKIEASQDWQSKRTQISIGGWEVKPAALDRWLRLHPDVVPLIHERILAGLSAGVAQGSASSSEVGNLRFPLDAWRASPVWAAEATRRGVPPDAIEREVRAILRRAQAQALAAHLGKIGPGPVPPALAADLVELLDAEGGALPPARAKAAFEVYVRAFRADPKAMNSHRISYRRWYDGLASRLPEAERIRLFREHQEFLGLSSQPSDAGSEAAAFGRRYVDWLLRAEGLPKDEFVRLWKNATRSTGGFASSFYERGQSPVTAKGVAAGVHRMVEREFPALDRVGLYEEFIAQFEAVGQRALFLDGYDAWMPADRASRVDFIRELLSKYGASRVDVGERGLIISLDYDGPRIQQGLSFKLSPPSAFVEAFRDPQLRAEVGPAKLTDLFAALMEKGVSGEVRDELFEVWWRETAASPDLRRRFQPEWVRGLWFSANQRRVAEWQLEDRFRLRYVAEEVKRTPLARRAGSGVRPVVREVEALLRRQFPELGHVRQELAGQVEKALVTNAEESAIVDGLRVSAENWAEGGKGLQAMDLPQILVSGLKPPERLRVLEYLMGVTPVNPMPEILGPNVAASNVRQASDALDSARLRYRDASVDARTYHAMALVDPEKGILSDPATTDALLKTLLGGRGDQALVKALMRAYLDAVPESRRSVIVSRLSALRSEGGPTGEVSLGRVLEMMGPLGIKAGQFLVSSGIGGAELRDELRDLLNRADPPNRAEVFGRIEKLLGPGYRVVAYVGELVGSGSVNYVARALVNDPRTGKPREVVVRVLRAAVEGRVHNEEQVWRGTVTNLRRSGDPDQVRAAKVIEEARQVALRTLEPGGQELDLGIEREWHPRLAAAYERPAGALGAFRVEVTRPLEELMGELSPESRRAISMYDFVDGVPLWEVKDRVLRARLARQILSTELRAMLREGTFDPDPTLGNWIVDLRGRRLVRIDYSQALHLDAAARSEVRETMRLLLKPRWSEADLDRLAAVLPSRLDAGRPLRPDAVRAWLEDVHFDPALPAYTDPQERLFYLRERLEARSGLSIRTREETQAVFASLGKLMNLREHAGDSLFLATLIHDIGLSPSALAADRARSAARSAGDLLRCLVSRVLTRGRPAP